ncbi:FecR domain-containing protein [Chitinophaga pendula]|uniref:FecR family protein n=1 Tax=Chitinophaga TaxID=79328 RepID=UPI000BB02231|nr:MULTISPECIES: FecR domain-containing protein [Chitinophaga]ASZ13684.1 hypothetical protein CK934_23370 [Chitinophaga sp. MD30]UCJ08699.1 FecR domain-containing protein [Chitinophaga pendula]
MSEQQFVNELLHRYLTGECTPAEQQIIQQWYDQLDLTAHDPQVQNKDLTETAFQRLRNQLPSLPKDATAKRLPIIRRRYIRWIAAAVIIGLSVVYLLPHLQTSKKAAPTTISIVNTDSRQLKHIQLPDGSSVWLNRLSRLEWATSTDDTVRLVKLSGEALFNIKPYADKPFVVQAGPTRTLVLGTEFNVEAYTGEQEIKVALLSGKVQLSTAGDISQTILQPGKLATWSVKNKSYKISTLPDDVSTWTKGYTVFNEVPLTSAINRLAKRYNWKVVWHRKNKPDIPVSAIFSKETPTQMLQGIAFTYHLTLTIQGDTVFIK